jgi:type I restriction enzyme R subunit
MFRKDVGSSVRLYDFMSQIINYGDPSSRGSRCA